MKIKICIVIFVLVLSTFMFASCQSTQPDENPGDANSVPQTQNAPENQEQHITETPEENTETNDASGAVTKMLYQGHASFRITAKNGTIIYIDPSEGTGYDVPADIILVTHQHDDHNKVKLVTKKDDCTLITHKEALESGVHNTFSVKGIEIEAVESYNSNHTVKNSVGYIITVDGIKIYHAGDTSKIDAMDSFAEKSIDYALLPCDGVFNMNAKEAAECAKIINAKHNIPIHTKVGELFNLAIAESFDAPNRLIVNAGEEIVLEK